MSRKGILVVALLFGVAFALLALATRGYREVEAMQSMEKAIVAVRREFPEAKPISAAELAVSLEGQDKLVLVDAREAEEFELSHLPGAVRELDARAVAELAKGAKSVVVYDSVGFRSAELVTAANRFDLGNISYLEGGLFAWANERYPLVDAEGNPTTKVHPYNKLWGRLLESR